MNENKSLLTDEEIKIFNSYMDDCMDSIAFGNSDWNKIYIKITNGILCEKAKEEFEKDC